MILQMFGRFEMFTFSVFLSVLSLILLAACQNIQTYFVSLPYLLPSPIATKEDSHRSPGL